MKEKKPRQWIRVLLWDPRTHGIERCLYVKLARPWQAIEQDGSKPRNQLVNDDIVFITEDREKVDVFWPTRPFKGLTFYHCAHCGATFGVLPCQGCGADFLFDPDVDTNPKKGMGCPLPAKIEEFLDGKFEDGYFFPSPLMQRCEENKAWRNIHEGAKSSAKT